MNNHGLQTRGIQIYKAFEHKSRFSLCLIVLMLYKLEERRINSQT